MKKLFYLLTISIILWACTEENLDQQPTTSYTIQLEREHFSPNSYPPVTDSATITLNINNTIYSMSTDSLLCANFKNIKSGTATVSINFSQSSNGIEYLPIVYNVFIVDKESQSTKVKLIATGINYGAQLDAIFTADGATITKPINVTYHLKDSLSNFVQHNGKGAISSVWYNFLSFEKNSIQNGKLSCTMPASINGLTYIINADDFIDDNSGKIYTFAPQEITLYSGKKSVVEFKYN